MMHLSMFSHRGGGGWAGIPPRIRNVAGPFETSVHQEYHSNNPNHRQSHPFSRLNYDLKTPKPPFFSAAQINRSILHVKFISQLHCEDERQMALNLELKTTWNWPLVHILSRVTDNCSPWISGRERMAVEMISWRTSTKESCRTGG